ncbi:MAG: hypothetical protein KDB07_13115 [Planctomycetes bacterium]|nr:hypothetical protein [Planctomycetota bacterium]
MIPQIQPYRPKKRYSFLSWVLLLSAINWIFVLLAIGHIAGEETLAWLFGLPRFTLVASYVLIVLASFALAGRGCREREKAALTHVLADNLRRTAKPVKPIAWHRITDEGPPKISRLDSIVLLAFFPIAAGRRIAAHEFESLGGDAKEMGAKRATLDIDGEVRRVTLLFWIAQPPEWSANRVIEVVVSSCGRYVMPADAYDIFRQDGPIEERRERYRSKLLDAASNPDVAKALKRPNRMGFDGYLVYALMAISIIGFTWSLCESLIEGFRLQDLLTKRIVVFFIMMVGFFPMFRQVFKKQREIKQSDAVDAANTRAITK